MSNKTLGHKAARQRDGIAPPYAPQLRASKYAPSARKRVRPQRLSFRSIWVQVNKMIHVTASRSKRKAPPRRLRRREAMIAYHAAKRRARHAP